MQIVNGYPCFSCGDVSKAKQNVDPKDAGAAQASGAQPAGGAPAGAAPDGINRPLADGTRGTLLNLSA